MPKVTIAIPAYNAERTIKETLTSALQQDYPDKEILVLDDGSTDMTALICKDYPVRVVSQKNMGIGKALAELMRLAQGKYVVYLCADDVFTNSQVVSDIARIFNHSPNIGVITRYFYQFMDGYPGAIMTSRDKNVLTSTCCPSGVAFRRNPDIYGTNDIFIELPSIVVQYLRSGFDWTLMEYDTVAARIHPGGNTGTKTSYYQGSMYKNWASLCGDSFRFNAGLIQIKNRAPKNLWKEIKAAWKYTPHVRREPDFYFWVAVAVLVPGFLLRPLSNFYRHRLMRRFCHIIPREE